MTNPEVDDFLEHFGVKGMKWGVIHDDPSGHSTGNYGASLMSDEDKNVLANMGLSTSPLAVESMRKKYGPSDEIDTTPIPPAIKKGLSPGQKKAILFGVAAVGLVGLSAYAVYTHNQGLAANKGNLEELLLKGFDANAAKAANAPKLDGSDLEAFKKFVNASDKVKLGSLDPSKLRTTPVHLTAGSVLSRVSMTPETTIRPGGFFAAYKPEDVTRYKAALPAYWRAWGYTQTSGFVNHYEAVKDVKAPSAKGTYDMVSSFLKEETINGVKAKDYVLNNHRLAFDCLPKNQPSDSDYVKFVSSLWAQGWAGQENPISEAFFNYAKSKGYNALVDINDAGSLGEEPLRIIDSSIFRIAGFETLSVDGIKAAREVVTAVMHAMGFDNVDDFLEHFGVKGMHWGQRKAPSSAKLAYISAKTDRKDLKNLEKTTYRGVVADRKAIKSRIKERVKNDPEYALAVKKIDSRSEDIAIATITTLTIGSIVVLAILGSKHGSTPINTVPREQPKTPKEPKPYTESERSRQIRITEAAYRREREKAGKSYTESFASRENRLRQEQLFKTSQKETTFNPNSKYWDGKTISGSVVNSSMDLVRRYP